VGEESIADYMDIVLKEHVEPRELLTRLQATLPEGFRVFEVTQTPLKAPALMAACTGFGYTLYAAADERLLAERIRSLLDAVEVRVERDVKVKDSRGRERRQKAEIDIRPMIRRLELKAAAGAQAVIELDVEIVEGRFARPREIAVLLGLDPVSTRILKRETYLDAGRTTVRELAPA
jgi:radical SAM-linked protein